MKEYWSLIPDFERDYYISNLGNLKNHKNRRLKIQTDRNGYKYFRFSVNKIKKRKYIHRLVAEAFIENPQYKPEVHHIDHNKANNRVDNLMWVTTYENNALNYDNPNLRPFCATFTPTPEWRQMISDACLKGSQHPKFSGYYVINGKIYESSLAAEKDLGIHRNTIQRKCKITKPTGFDFIPAPRKP